MNRRTFLLSPFIIKQIAISDGKWIEIFIARRYVNDKYYLKRHLIKFCKELDVDVDLLMYKLRYIELTKNNQKYLALKGRRNNNTLELRIGTVTRRLED